MANKIKTLTVLRQNYREVIFVFLAFALLILTANIFIGRILKSHLLDRTQEIMYSAGANVMAGLSEAETTLLNSYYIVQGMIERDAPQQEILDYLNVTTEWMRRREQGLLDYYGIYGYINGEFYDSMGLNTDGNYIPQRRPWYQTAVRSGNSVAYTAPYPDERTGDSIVSAVRNIDINGSIVGILSIDININWLHEYISSLSLAGGGYGMLLSQNMTLMVHPEKQFLGSQLQELGAYYAEIARILRSGEKVFDHHIKNSQGVILDVFFANISNDWHIGIIIPYFRFYKDLYVADAILILLGLSLSCALSYIQLRLSAARMRADEESKAKSSFLANMSHEIRTPMNAITGMAELLLRGELSDEAKGYAHDIKQAGQNLISIINDILDFSKIEAGKMEIIPVNYLLASLLNDTVNIVRMRIAEKPIRFYTNIDGSIPDKLIGDEVRIRQILLNLLSNAVKYTDRGHISLTITVHEREEKQIRLKITVTDTGKGMTPDDLEKLFFDFVQIDTRKNRGIEGTGLGLAITRRLCIAMGGDIDVESEYGCGSVFTVTIPQGTASNIPFAAVEKPEKKKVLVYERRVVYAESVCWSLNQMGVSHTLVTNIDDFNRALFQKEWFYVFSGYGLYEEIKQVMEQPDDRFPGGKKPNLALMTEFGEDSRIPNVRFVSLPVQSLSIANVLNSKADTRNYTESFGMVRFIIPQARILVVDDISVNLKVVEGLLMPYQAAVDTCLNGIQAIEMVKHHEYDIVFMDHMMPEMDGIEATAIIREWESEQQKKNSAYKQVPVIALTANAVVGMREMFLEKGFNDFLAKPIDISKMEEILARWIAKDKREAGNGDRNSNNDSTSGQYPGSSDRESRSLNIPGVDVQKGIAMTGGTEAGYRQVLALFGKDAQDRLPLLQTVPAAEVLPQFITQVHALKSAAASLGAAGVSAEAARLEAAGKDGDLIIIQQNLGVFADHLAELVNNINAVLKTEKPESGKINTDLGDSPLLYILLGDLKSALEEKKSADIDQIMEKLLQQVDSPERESLERISNDVLMAEFSSALETLEEMLKIM